MVLTEEQRRNNHNKYQREYQKKLYQSNPEYAEKRKKQIMDKYALITPEEKQRRNEYAKEYYYRKKAERQLS